MYDGATVGSLRSVCMVKRRHDAETTRQELVSSARAIFSTVGYAAARTEEIVASTGLTRGALYHHFGSKEGLFAAVLEEVHVELAAEVGRRARLAGGGPLDGLRAGFHAWLDVALQDNVRQVLLVDGPAVVGWDRWQALDLEHGFAVTRAALDRAMAAGEIAAAPLDELTHLLLGAVTHAGLELGRARQRRGARRRYHEAIDLLLDKLGR